MKNNNDKSTFIDGIRLLIALLPKGSALMILSIMLQVFCAAIITVNAAAFLEDIGIHPEQSFKYSATSAFIFIIISVTTWAAVIHRYTLAIKVARFIAALITLLSLLSTIYSFSIDKGFYVNIVFLIFSVFVAKLYFGNFLYSLIDSSQNIHDTLVKVIEENSNNKNRKKYK